MLKKKVCIVFYFHSDFSTFDYRSLYTILGRRHQSKEYKPHPKKPKDEVKHSKFWRRKKWKDPCIEKRQKIFGKCNFGMMFCRRFH